MTNFGKLGVWQKSIDLSASMYELCDLQPFLKRNYGLRDQIQRASVSIPSNIAEWSWRQTDKEFIRFLYIARGSCCELFTQITILLRIKYIDSLMHFSIIQQIEEIQKMINGLISSLSKQLATKD